MTSRSGLSPERLLQGYASGIFPMSEGRDTDEIFWVDPRQRGIFPLDRFHISRSLRKTLLKEPFRLTLDQAFMQVVEGCADRADTWINRTIFNLYGELHALGFAHSIEVWDNDDLVGGVYGVTLKAAFFGESMFSRRTDASKIALAYLVASLRSDGFKLFDTQFLTDHLASLGAIEVPRHVYQQRLADALEGSAKFGATPLLPSQEVVQLSTQTS
ncbi:leucyl/phenylalanyl-tRNA--protein transferase [Aestuariibius insulae]|uniref:leucyl/phenylalanyl-tRNA--protein transferase n=1 Tax=Aestuariibius insulae TaxID=2058287 RepID=UPI00345ECDE3